jgi:hypothetical protein
MSERRVVDPEQSRPVRKYIDIDGRMLLNWALNSVWIGFV